MSEQIKHHIETQKQKVLSDREQARLRLPVFFGSFDSSFHAFIEQLMNARDELFNHNNGGEVHITLDEDMKTVTVQDNGRGIPIHGIDEDTNKPNYELVFETLFSGGNYDNAYSDDLIETIGGNGCGNSTTAYSSLYFQATEFKNNKAYQITYHNGCLEKEYKEFDSPDFEHGTRITYMLDDNVYTTNVYNPKDMFNQIRRVSGTSNNIKYYFHHNNETTEFLFDSYEDYIDDTNTNKLTNNIHFPLKNYEIKAKKDGKEFLEKDRIEVIISLSTEPVQETYLNGGYLPEQGTFYKGIVEGIRKFLQKDIKDKKVKLTDNDIIMSFNIYGIMGSNNPVYSNQTKRASSNEAYRKLASQYIIENMEVFKHENPKIYQQIIEHVSKINGLNVKSEDTIKKLKNTLAKNNKSGLSLKIEGLKDCDMKHSDLEERIYIVDEGLSANSTIIDAFDNRYMGCMGLRGRFINSLKSNIEDVLNNEPALGIIQSLGCGIEIPPNEIKRFKDIPTFNIDNLRYGKIAILCDMDSFGKGISLAILTFFYKFMPTLLKQGRVYCVISPRYEIRNKKKESFYAYNEQEKERIVKELGVDFFDISIRKGLGEFNKEEFWEHVLSPEARKNTFIKVVYDESEDIETWFNTLMGEDIDGRKKYIRENIINVNLDELD